MNERITAKSAAEAWKMAAEIFGCSYERDEEASKSAGYSIYRGNSDVHCWISDLGNVLELNMSDGSVIRIHIETEEKLYTAAEVRMIIKEAREEIAAAEKICCEAFAIGATTVTMQVIELANRRKREYENKLAEFGIEF